jgi:hypothetical protein
MSLLTMSIISVLLVIILIIGIILKDNYKNEVLKPLMIFLSAICLMIIGMVGFGFHACETHEKVIVEKMIPDTIIKSQYKVYVEFKDTSLIYKDKRDYDEINDSTVFYKVRYFNMYDSELTNDEKITKDKRYGECEFNKKFKNLKVKI